MSDLSIPRCMIDPETIPCPVEGCPVEAVADDLVAQRNHMTAPETLVEEHAAFIEQRMVDNGFRRHPLTGEWIDIWASDG